MYSYEPRGNDCLLKRRHIWYFMHHLFPPRPASCDELHPEVHASSFSHHSAGLFHGHHLLHYGVGALQVQNAQDLLLHRHKYVCSTAQSYTLYNMNTRECHSDWYCGQNYTTLSLMATHSLSQIEFSCCQRN